ncbi:hypothetical protein N7541_003527 [Penicillium brevicompactum]|uniref:Uncharacterized protein n=1 Tax=Penicillium brevicompactum TaxID=5074 RepID=A0A9W9RRW8_PENBR|nr:hypothetical protein N7541_003527 [Penicillium brevicompactum]
MSNSPRARSASRAFSARAVAEATPNSTEWNSWFSPWFTALDDALSVSSEQTARDSFFSRPESLAPTAIIQSTEAEERLQFSRTHLAREAHKRKRYQSTRATSEDVTMACGSPTPTVRESTEFLQKTPASWRLSATKSASVMPPLTPFSESLSPGPIFGHEFVTNATTFSDGHDGLRSPAQFSEASRIFQSYQPRDTSRVSEVPSLSRSSTDRYSISPAAHSNGSSRESRPPFPGPSSPGLACDLQLGEDMASLFGNAEKCGSSPIPSRNCSPLARDATRSLGTRGQSDRGASKFLRELRSRIANGPPGVSQSLICDRWVQERTIGLLRYHREIIPNLWDEDDAMFESRHLDRDAAYTFCYGTAKEEMLHELERMSSRDSNQSHKSSPSTRDIVPPAVVISSVDGHEDEPRSSRTVHQLPEAIVSRDRQMERGGGSALEGEREETVRVELPPRAGTEVAANGPKGTPTSVVAAPATGPIAGATTGQIEGAATREKEDAGAGEVDGSTDGLRDQCMSSGGAPVEGTRPTHGD